jgi:hypothetical protein
MEDMLKDKKEVELNFLYSLFEASNIYYSKEEYTKLNNLLKQSGLDKDYFNTQKLDLQNIKKYTKLNLQRKQIVMEYVEKNLEKATYNKQLVAAWSSFFLVNHLETLKNPENDIIYNTIEMPLRKMNSNLKIRGAPYYNI